MLRTQHKEKQDSRLEQEGRKGMNLDPTEQEESSTSTLKIVLNFELRVINICKSPSLILVLRFISASLHE